MTASPGDPGRSEPEPDPASLLEELQRRRVIRVAVLYAAGAFVVLQAADIIFPALSLPEWAFRLLVVGSILAFPLVLVVSWVFDITPDGVRRTEGLQGATGVRKAARIGLLAVTVALVAGAGWLSYRWARSAEGGSGLDPRTVAVLPFEDFNRTEETSFFASGLHDDVLSQLSRIRGLRVISRTSVLQYAGGDKALPVIGRELGAGTILEGSVRQSGDSVRVVLQLVDARDDAHIWSETYDRPRTDIFQVQSEIARAVAVAMEAELTDEQAAEIASAPTADLEAYTVYQRGRARYDRRESRADALEAVVLFESAVELDPRYARAWAALSQARMWLFWNWADFEDLAVSGAEALARAEALAPGSVETLLAQGYFEYWGQGDLDRALDYFQAAAREAPTDATVLQAMGLVLRSQGRWDDAAAALVQALRGNPRSYSLAWSLAQTYTRMRRVEDADRLLSLAADIADLPEAREARIRLQLEVAGDTVRARELLDALGETLSGPGVARLRSQLAAARGQLDSAVVRAERSRPADDADLGAYYRWMGTLLHAAGRWERRAAYGDSLETVAVTFLAGSGQRAGSTRPAMVAAARGELGMASALQGVRLRAIREGTAAAALLPLERDAFRGAEARVTLATVYVLTGEHETALVEIERLLAIPSPLSPQGIRLDPAFAPLADLPRFQALAEGAPAGGGP